MNDLERFQACMNYEAVDKIPFWNWGAWPEKLSRLPQPTPLRAWQKMPDRPSRLRTAR